MNLMQFQRADGSFAIAAYEHATRLWTVTLEIAVLMAQFQSKERAKLFYDYSPPGLGYAHIGARVLPTGLLAIHPSVPATTRALPAPTTPLPTPPPHPLR